MLILASFCNVRRAESPSARLSRATFFALRHSPRSNAARSQHASNRWNPKPFPPECRQKTGVPPLSSTDSLEYYGKSIDAYGGEGRLGESTGEFFAAGRQAACTFTLSHLHSLYINRRRR